MLSRSTRSYACASDFKRSQFKKLSSAIQLAREKRAKRQEKIIIFFTLGILFLMLIFSELIN